MPYDPSFYGIFWGHIFANMGGGGGQNYFYEKRFEKGGKKDPKNDPKRVLKN